MKAKTIDGTLRAVLAEALVDTTADTLPEIRAMVKRGGSGGRGTARRAGLHASKNGARKN